MSRIEHNQSIVLSEEEEEEDDDKVVETDPNGIYVRFEHKLGSGAFKTVYRALDTERGIEVAWNQVLIDRFQLDKDKVLREIEFFKQIRHKHVIDFYHFWTDERKNQVVFITELMPSGTLTDYIEKSPEVKLKIIKSWCKQILAGLNYLHTQDPPIIHRDIKCGNIFINGTTEGEVKIGDLGLATFCQKKDALSVIGTPEFMAPEYYNEVYTTSVDIWAFGMAMIEMVTRQCPYAECDNVGQIFKKVSGGVRPQQLELIQDPEVKAFINLCLADEQERPTAAQLLAHRFFVQDSESDNNPVRVARPNEITVAPVPPAVQRLETPDHLPTVGEGVEKPAYTVAQTSVPQASVESSSVYEQSYTLPTPDVTEKSGNHSERVSTVYSFDMNVVSHIEDNLEIEADMGMEDGNTKETSKIQFSYNLSEDDPKQTAIEMVKSLDLDDASIQIICGAFEELVRKYQYPLSHDRTQTLTELSSLVCEDPDLDPQPRVQVLTNSGDSIHSEPLRQTPQKFNYDPNVTLSDSDAPFVGSSNMSDDGVTDLEFLVEDSDNGNHLTPLSNELQDNTDLEDLLDDSGDELYSDEVRSNRSKSFDDDDDTMISSSDFSEEEDEEIQALKAKHEKDMRDLLQRQQNELRLAEQDILRKKQSKKQQNENEPNGSHSETSRKLKDYFDHQQAQGKYSFGVNPSALCI